ncbi:MAG: hypothetical protein HFH34_01415 [Eubacterium sp.]|nr:hypothetical protein [Eubacterium sp.]
MEDGNRNQYGQGSRIPADQRSVPMTTAAVVLSIIAISTISCTYLSLICGVLGITFALLSKGGEQTMSPHARSALSVSITAIVLTVLLLAGTFLTMILQYGSLEAFWNVYMEMLETYSSAGTL